MTPNEFISKSWHQLTEENERLKQQNAECIEALRGVTKALQRVLDKHDPDSIEYEWVGEANEIILKATGKNLR